MSGMIQKTLHYGRIEQITVRLTPNGLRTLLEQANEVPPGFVIESCDMGHDIEIVLRREKLDQVKSE